MVECAECMDDVEKCVMIIDTSYKDLLGNFVPKYYCKECFKNEFVPIITEQEEIK